MTDGDGASGPQPATLVRGALRRGLSGAGKADVLDAVLHGPQNVAEYPSQGVAPTNGTLTWLISNA